MTLIYEFVYGTLYRMADATVKASLLLGLAAIFSLLLRRSYASVRHLVWALGLGSALLLPLLSWNMPHWRVPYPAPPTHSRPAATVVPPPAQAPQPASGAAVPRGPQFSAGITPVASSSSSTAEKRAMLPPVRMAAPNGR